MSVFLEFIDDDINEALEGFFAVLELDTSDDTEQSGLDDDITFIREGVTLIIIRDDDGKTIFYSN